VRKVRKDGQGVEWVQISAEEVTKVANNGGKVAAHPSPPAPETSTSRGGGASGGSVAIGMVAAVGAGAAAYYMIQEGIVDAPELKAQLPFKLKMPEGMPEIKLPDNMPKVSDIKLPENMPELKMPDWMPNLSEVSFPKMPDGVPQMPQMPELPDGLADLKIPEISMPKLPESLADLKVPELSMPKLPEGFPEMPKLPEGFPEMPKLPEGFPEMPKLPERFPEMPKLPEGFPEMPKLPEGLSDLKMPKLPDVLSEITMPEMPKGMSDIKMPKLPEGLSDLKMPDMPKMPEGVPKMPELPELNLPEMGVADVKVPGGESIRSALASLPDWKLPSLPAFPSLPGFGGTKKAPASPAASEKAAPPAPPPPALEEEPKSSEVVGKEPVTHENVKESPAAQAPAPTLAANSKTDARAETDGPVENEGRSAADAQAEAKDIFSDPVELPAVELEPEPEPKSNQSSPAPDTASADGASASAPGGDEDGELESDPLEELLKSQSASPHDPPHPDPPAAPTPPTQPAPATEAPASSSQEESEREASKQDPKDVAADEEAEDPAEAARLQAVRDEWAEEEAERATEEATAPSTPPAPPAEEDEAKPATPLTAMEEFEREMMSKYKEDAELPFASFAMIFQAMKHQAGVDTAIFDKAMAAQKRQSQEEIDKLKQQLESANEIVDNLQAAYQKQVMDADTAIARTEATLQREKEDELEEQQLQMMLDAEEVNLKIRQEHLDAKIAERAVRMQAIDSMRMKVNALHSAFGDKLKAPMVSHKAHRMAVGSFALAATLQEGEPFARELEWLTQASEQDPLVLAAARAVPESAARSGAATRTMLTEQFHHMKQTIRQKCLVPASGGGMLSSAVARLAAALRVEEAPGVLSQSEGVEASLSTAQRLLADGHLLEAAALLEHTHASTAAAPVVAQWAKAVRDRVVAEQMLELLETHAAAIAVGLS